jgi:hypothetical protein
MAESDPGGDEPLERLDLGGVARDETGKPWLHRLGEVAIYTSRKVEQLMGGPDFWLGDRTEVGDEWPAGFDDVNEPRIWHPCERLECFLWSIRYGYADRTPEGKPGITYVALPETGGHVRWRRSVKEPFRGRLWTPVLVLAKRVDDEQHEEAAVLTGMEIAHSGNNELCYSGLSLDFDYESLLRDIVYPRVHASADVWLLAHDVQLLCLGEGHVYGRSSTHTDLRSIDGDAAEAIWRALNGEHAWLPACDLPAELQQAVADFGRRWVTEA